MIIQETHLTAWLSLYFPDQEFVLHPVPGDASFRRYFRLHVANQSYIAVDAPPGTENNHAFIQIAKAFSALGLHVPQVLHADLTQGFLLLTDLGDDVFFNIVTSENADTLYRLALYELGKIQRCQIRLPAFDTNFMTNELQLFRQWVIDAHLQLKLSPATRKMLDNTFTLLCLSATEQPQCCVHRDYHSRNLMLLPEQKIGILDFQDAVRGPVTYDAVSLLRDCYIAWPPQQVIQWLQFFHVEVARTTVPSFEQLLRWFDLMGIQRHLKASFIFARKFHRDGVQSYLSAIPRTMCYVLDISQHYTELKDFRDWLANEAAPKLINEPF